MFVLKLAPHVSPVLMLQSASLFLEDRAGDTKALAVLEGGDIGARQETASNSYIIFMAVTAQVIIATAEEMVNMG